MIRAFSQRLMPPYSGQIQIAQSPVYRALTLDGDVWEVQYVKRTHVRVATLTAKEIRSGEINAQLAEGGKMDPELVELLGFLKEVELPFAAADHYEFWLLDRQDETPLALIYSCAEAAQMEKFPGRPDWTALPAAVMPVEKTPEEKLNQTPPVNYRVEQLVAERSGHHARTCWVKRSKGDAADFPPLMITEQWPNEADAALCQRYLERQAPRLLMLHGLSDEIRGRLEQWSRSNAAEVARFSDLYPKILDEQLIKTLRVEARLRGSSQGAGHPSVHTRRDGVLYI